MCVVVCDLDLIVLYVDPQEDNFLPSDSAPPVYGVPPPPTETKESSQRGDHSVSEDIEEESVSEWEIERQMEKVGISGSQSNRYFEKLLTSQKLADANQNNDYNLTSVL